MNSSKRSGTVGEIISGTGGLILVVIIVLLIVSTLLGASLLRSSTTLLAGSTTTESDIYLNGTNFSVGQSGATGFADFTVTGIVNSTDGATILVANVTQYPDGKIINASALWEPTYVVNVTYTYNYVGINTEYENVSNRMAYNMTEGIDNVSSKLPTILLIAAVILLFGVIILLIRKSDEMGFGGSSGASL